MKKLLLFIPIIIFISSCTITKRVHRPGFYISSHRNIIVTKAKEETKTYIVEEKVDTTSTPVSNNTAEKKEVVGITKTKSYQVEKTETKVVKAPVLKEKFKSSKSFFVDKVSKNKKQVVIQRNNYRDINYFALMSFLFLILGAVSFIVGWLIIDVILILFLFLIFVSFILGFISIINNKNNRYKSDNSWMAIPGFVLGVIGLLFFGLLLLLGWPILGSLILLTAILPIILIIII